MIDKGLLSKVRQIYGGPRPTVKLSDVLAIIDKESGGNPTFLGAEPLFRMNLNMAVSWFDKAHNKTIQSGATSTAVRNAIVIPNGPMRGMWCKFRFEPVYWDEFAKPLAAENPGLWTPAEIVLLSSSVGLGQQMLRYVVEKQPPEKMLDAAHAFMGDVSEQIRWVIGNLEKHAGNDRQLMFARYNLGGAVKGGKTYYTYGANVLARAEKIDKELEEQS